MALLLWSLVTSSVTPASPTTAFILERSTNANQLVYEVDLANPEDPIRPYWKMNAEAGQEEPLTETEKSTVYGVNIIERSAESIKFTFKAFPSLPVTIQEENGAPVASVTLLNETRTLKKIYLRLGGFLIPSVRSIEVECGGGEKIEISPRRGGAWKEELIRGKEKPGNLFH